MNWKKKEPLQLSIKKWNAGIEPVCGLFFFLFLFVFLTVQLELTRYSTSGWYLEDALAASNLASAVIDLEEYGISHRICIRDYEQAYVLFQQAVKGNLNLDENWESVGIGLIAGPVKIQRYIIYNVQAGEIISRERTQEGNWRIATGARGTVYAPDGELIVHTGIYSEITYKVKGLFGREINACKGKLVDIVSNNG